MIGSRPLVHLLFGLFFLNITSEAGVSQQNTDSQYIKQFVSQVREGCERDPGSLPPGIDPVKFCACYSSIFADGYTAEDLRVLSALATASDKARGAVNVTLNPRRKICLADR